MAQVITQEQFNTIEKICKSYDAFTQYIDDYKQMKSAEASNEKLGEKFRNIMKEIGLVNCTYIPSHLTNAGTETAEKLTGWLLLNDVTVEEKAKRIWTADEIKSMIQTNDKVLYGALKKLYACQTADEQNSGETTHANGAGFNAIDAEFLTSCSQFLLKNGFLTDKQKVIVRKKLVKYNKQLTMLANA